MRLRSCALLLAVATGCAAGELRPDGRTGDHRPQGREARLTDSIPPDDLPSPGDLPRDLAAIDHAKPDLASPDTRPPDKGAPDKTPLDKAIPDKPKPDTKPAPLQTLLSLDFEGGKAGLVPSKDWEWGVLKFVAGSSCDSASAPPPSCHSGTHCWGTVLNNCHNPLGNANDACNNLSTTDDSVLRLDTAIPASYKSARLTYWEWRDYFLPYDWAELRVNGAVLYQDCKSSYVTPTAWVKRTVLLNGYIGKTIAIAWHFMATTVINHAGWYIDDVVIEEY